MMDNATGRPSTPGLLADALAQMTTLFETELRLVRSEIGERINQAIGAAAVLAIAAVLMLVALILLLEGLVQLLIASGWQPYAAHAMVGAVLAALGGVAVVVALKVLGPRAMLPSRSMRQFEKDARIVKERVG